MPSIIILHNLPFITVQIQANNQTITLDHVLLDTGSAASIFKTEVLETLGITLQPEDRVRFMAGVGGREIVVEKQIDSLSLGILAAQPFTIQMGALDYGIPMNGILGLDFMLMTKARIDLGSLKIQ